MRAPSPVLKDRRNVNNVRPDDSKAPLDNRYAVYARLAPIQVSMAVPYAPHALLVIIKVNRVNHCARLVVRAHSPDRVRNRVVSIVHRDHSLISVHHRHACNVRRDHRNQRMDNHPVLHVPLDPMWALPVNRYVCHALLVPMHRSMVPLPVCNVIKDRRNH